MPNSRPIELEFANKYDSKHANMYFHKHNTGVSRRMSHWREEQIARAALKMAGHPNLVLDLPSGAGRFWPLLCEQPNRVILAADNSQDMLDAGFAGQPSNVVARVKSFQTSAFDIDLGENAVDCIFSMRLMHHIGKPEHRQTMLKEFKRVTRDTVVISLWVDGNYKAWKRQRSEARRPLAERAPELQNRFVIPRATIEAEFKQAGFEIVGHKDFIPGYALWRIYVLRKLD